MSGIAKTSFDIMAGLFPVDFHFPLRRSACVRIRQACLVSSIEYERCPLRVSIEFSGIIFGS